MANPVLLGANNAPQAKSMMTALTGLVEDGGRVGQIHSDRKVFTPITASAKASYSYSYNGYFKITDASEGDAFKVKVADGATGGASTCKVNNIVFSVPAWTSEAITATRLIVLKYTAATKASGETPAAAAKVELVLLETLPNDDNLNCYYQIGRAIVDRDGSRKIQQDHNAVSSNGIAQIYWYNLCEQ
jgi:hypothetical protein